MRAAYYEKNGAARDVLHVAEVETPTPGPGEVRVRLKTSGVNPSDVKAREGRTRKIAYPRVIPHSDGAGEIDMVGDGVPASRKGERVWVWNGQWKRPFGTCAEYIVLPAALAVAAARIGELRGRRLPRHSGDDGLSRRGGRQRGQGHQRSWSPAAPAASAITPSSSPRRAARPCFTTVSSEAKAKLARRPAPTTPSTTSARTSASGSMALTGKAGVDAVIEMDLAANAKLYPGLLRPRGHVVVYGTGSAEAAIPAQPLLVNAIKIEFIFVYELTAAEREAAVSAINRMLENKTLINNVALTLPLNDIVAAHEAVEQGRTMGNVVVTL